MSKPKSPFQGLSPCALNKLNELKLVVIKRRACRTRVDCEFEIDELLSDFKGDARAVIAALLLDLDAIISDYEQCLSAGYIRRPLTVIP